MVVADRVPGADDDEGDVPRVGVMSLAASPDEFIYTGRCVRCTAPVPMARSVVDSALRMRVGLLGPAERSHLARSEAKLGRQETATELAARLRAGGMDPGEVLTGTCPAGSECSRLRRDADAARDAPRLERERLSHILLVKALEEAGELEKAPEGCSADALQDWARARGWRYSEIHGLGGWVQANGAVPASAPRSRDDRELGCR